MNFDFAEYVESNLDNVRQSSGDELTAVCPWCDRFGAFYVNTNTGNYVCFKCDESGRGLVGVIAEVQGLEWGAARRWMFRQNTSFHRRRDESEIGMLRERLGALNGTDAADEEYEDISLPKEFRPVFKKNGRWSTPKYLRERGLKRETARAWGLGFCNSGWFEGRLVMPFSCPNGRSFVARDLTGDQEPKYLNPKDSNQSRLVYGWNIAEEGCDIVIVEGPLDALKMWQHGFVPIALFGKQLHLKQVQLIAALRPASITVMLDPDALAAAEQSAIRLLLATPGVYVATLPVGVDPGDSTREQATSAVNVAEPFDGSRPRRFHTLRSRLSAVNSGG